MDVPQGIVQEPLDSEMSRNGGWRGKFSFPRRSSSRSCGSSSGSSADPLLQHLDIPLHRLIDRIDGVRRCSEEGVGDINTGDFSRGDVPLKAYEYFAVMKGEHGARCTRARFVVVSRLCSWLTSMGRWRPFDHVEGGCAFERFLQQRPMFAGNLAVTPHLIAGKRWGLD
jgi:hypothetical protein